MTVLLPQFAGALQRGAFRAEIPAQPRLRRNLDQVRDRMAAGYLLCHGIVSICRIQFHCRVVITQCGVKLLLLKQLAALKKKFCRAPPVFLGRLFLFAIHIRRNTASCVC